MLQPPPNMPVPLTLSQGNIPQVGPTSAGWPHVLFLGYRTPDGLRGIRQTSRTCSPHLEVETYTWDVLPQGLRAGKVEDAVARELGWVLEGLGL